MLRNQKFFNFRFRVSKYKPPYDSDSGMNAALILQ